MDFEFLWALLYEHGASAKKEEGTRRFWDTLTETEQLHVFNTISTKLKKGKFVHYDPIRAIKENRPREQQQILSYNEYYARYGTTLEQDGWRMANPTGQKVIYVRN